jgi:hypothetical protein
MREILHSVMFIIVVVTVFSIGINTGKKIGYEKARNEILTETVQRQDLLNKKVEQLQEMIK